MLKEMYILAVGFMSYDNPQGMDITKTLVHTKPYCIAKAKQAWASYFGEFKDQKGLLFTTCVNEHNHYDFSKIVCTRPMNCVS